MAMLTKELVHLKKCTNVNVWGPNVNQELYSECAKVKQFPPLQDFQTIFFNPEGSEWPRAWCFSVQVWGAVSRLLLSCPQRQTWPADVPRILPWESQLSDWFWHFPIHVKMRMWDWVGSATRVRLGSRSGNSDPPRLRRWHTATLHSWQAECHPRSQEGTPLGVFCPLQAVALLWVAMSFSSRGLWEASSEMCTERDTFVTRKVALRFRFGGKFTGLALKRCGVLRGPSGLTR